MNGAADWLRVERELARRGLAPSDQRLIRIEGERTLLERFAEPLRRALGGRRADYEVHIDSGRCGEVLVTILGAKGRLPLTFGQEEFEPGYLGSVVLDTVEKYDL